jgi:aryl-alcohol dehydrogenase-like predicted oxidoreductase
MTADESAAFQVMDAAIDAGINFFDTADVYGGPQSPDMAQGYGTSEEIIGRWLERNGRRDDIVLATKVYQPMGLGPNDRRLSAYHIRRACEASLRRLRTDHIDLYQAPVPATSSPQPARSGDPPRRRPTPPARRDLARTRRSTPGLRLVSPGRAPSRTRAAPSRERNR